MNAPDAFVPLLLSRGTSKHNRQYVGAWCDGYMRGLLLRPDDRNEPCPCGSGKKYKRCCGAA
jgi:uncharacterized protein YecA (UPF0149 family)